MMEIIKFRAKYEQYYKKILDNMKKRKGIIIVYFSFLLFYMLSNANNEILSLDTFKAEWIIFICVALSGFFCILTYSEKLHNVAFIVVFIFGLLSTFITPILDVPDENTHFARSELTSKGNIVPYASDGYNFEINKTTSDLDLDRSEVIMNSQIAQSEINYNTAYAGNVAAAYPFYGYIVQAIGINIAKTLGLEAIWLIWLGRIGNTLLSAIICRFAVKIAPEFKMHLLAIGCLPMAIYLSASLSIDAIINSSSLLVIAYFIRMYCAKDNSLSFKNIGVFLLLCLVPGLAKFVYMAFAALIIFVPSKKFTIRLVFGIKVLSIFLMFILTVIWYLRSLTLPSMPAMANVNAAEQIKFILSNPSAFLGMLFEYIGISGPQLFNGLFTFGWLSYSTPALSSLYMMFYGALMILYPIKLKIRKMTRVGIFLICLVIYVSVGVIMYLTWTEVGGGGFSGVQSRYFIPLLALTPVVFGINNNQQEDKKIEIIFVSVIITFVACMLISTGLQYY